MRASARSWTCGAGSMSRSSASAGRLERRRGRATRSKQQLESAEAVGEVLIAPFDLDGRFVCPAMRERVIAFDARALGRVPVAIGVASGESQGPADAGRRPGRRRPVPGHRRGDRGSRRRPRCRDPGRRRGDHVPPPRRPSWASTSAPRRSRPVSSRWTGSCSVLPEPATGWTSAGTPGWAEQDPGAWWSAVVSAVRALRIHEVCEVVAIGVDGHGPTLVAVDARGEATRPAITWLDTRSIAEADELADATGVRGWALAGLPAALWVERHDPRAAEATRWYLSTWEWLAFRLTGVAGRRWSPDQLVAGPGARGRGGGRGRPPAADRVTGTLVGALTAAAADALGLSAGIPVAGGTVDAFASYLGAGLLEPATPTTRAAPPAGSASTGIARSRSPGGFVTPGAARRPVQRRRGDGRHRPGARLVPRRRSSAGRSRPSAARRGRRHARRAPTGSSSCRTSPASARRSGTRTAVACSPG